MRGKVDNLRGLKENVIIGKLIPAGTGAKQYSDIEIELEKELIEEDASEVIEDQLLATDENDAINSINEEIAEELVEEDAN